MARERIGNANINWQQVAFGIGKNRRKTVGFGSYNKKNGSYQDEIYIRELSIVNGGIGCALWDAAIILTRFLYEHGESLLNNESILELGAGVGLPGICAGRFGNRVVLTDYIDPVVQNLEYNLWLNGRAKLEELENEYILLGNNLNDLDANESLNSLESLESLNSMSSLENMDENNVEKKDSNVELKTDSSSKFVFAMPLNKQIKQLRNLIQNIKCALLDWYDIDTSPIKDTFDIVIGSELTYTESKETISSLCKVIDRFMNQDGIFFEILSDDRDGVSAFMDMITQEYNYVYSIHIVPEKYMNHFGTGQNPETYKFFLLAKEPNERFKKFQSKLGLLYKTNVSIEK